MSLPKLALGMRLMLLDAIGRHRKATYKATGKAQMPRRFEIHPALLYDLRYELKDTEQLEWRFSPNPDRPMFYGVEIVPDNLAERPKMITADNKVEYL